MSRNRSGKKRGGRQTIVSGRVRKDCCTRLKNTKWLEGDYGIVAHATLPVRAARGEL
jgi:hypothetical protein